MYWIGGNDRKLSMFEGAIPMTEGMAYNSYFIDDEKTVVLDTVDDSVVRVFDDNLNHLLNGRGLDYIIINHVEPDHSASLCELVRRHPETKIVATSKIKNMLKNYVSWNLDDNFLQVEEGEELSTGKHVFTFVNTPMVHWPEVMMTYEKTTGTMFSADAFGKFGALDVEEDWDCEARRYYFGIVGKYGVQVQNLLKAASALEIEKICPLHGPVLSENLEHYLGQYQTWSSYGVESEGVMIAYTSVYGNTKKAAELLGEKLKEKGCPKVVVCDLAREDMAEAVEDAFRYGKLVLATITYNGDIFPFMRTFIEHLKERNYQNRTIGLIENGSWASTAGKVIAGMLEKSKNITMLEKPVKIMSSLSEENLKELDEMAEELMK